MTSRKALLSSLEASGVIDESTAQAIERREMSTATDDPWYVQGVAIFGAWLASIFLLAFIGALVSGIPGGLAAYGVALLAFVVVTRRKQQTVFAEQFGLALAISGQLLIAFTPWWHDVHAEAGAAELATMVSIVMYFLYPERRFRFVSPLIALPFLLVWLCSAKGMAGVLNALLAVEVLLAALAYVVRPISQLRPLGLSMQSALCTTLIVMQYYTPLWPAQILLTIALLGLCEWIARGREGGHLSPAAVAGIIALGAVSSPGIVAGVALIALGFARADHLLLALGCIFLAVFVVFFYYFLDIDLATKSWILMGSGVLVLLTRSALIPRVGITVEPS